MRSDDGRSDVGENAIRGEAVHLGFGIKQDAVTGNREQQVFHVVGDGVVASFARGVSPRRRGQHACCPRGEAGSDHWMFAGRSSQRHDIPGDVPLDAHASGDLVQLRQLSWVQDRL